MNSLSNQLVQVHSLQDIADILETPLPPQPLSATFEEVYTFASMLSDLSDEELQMYKERLWMDFS